MLQLQRSSKLTKLGSAFGSRSSHHRIQQAGGSQSSLRTQDEGTQSLRLEPCNITEPCGGKYNVISLHCGYWVCVIQSVALLAVALHELL